MKFFLKRRNLPVTKTVLLSFSGGVSVEITVDIDASPVLFVRWWVGVVTGGVTVTCVFEELWVFVLWGNWWCVETRWLLMGLDIPAKNYNFVYNIKLWIIDYSIGCLVFVYLQFVGVNALLNIIGLEAPDDLVGECILRLLCVLPIEGLLLAWCFLE